MRLLALALVALVVAAGCVTPAQTIAPAATTDLANGAATWTGKELRAPRDAELGMGEIITRCLALGECPAANASCEPANCERTPFRVPGDAPYDGRLVVGLRWPSDESTWLALWIEDARGTVVAEGRSITVDHNGASALHDAPAPGVYTIVVAAAVGGASYEAAARLEPRATLPAAVADVLPDMTILPPTDLRIADPPGQFFMNAIVLPTNDAARAMGATGCASDEAAAGARRCLRFTNAVANVGAGPLDIHLSLPDGATYLAGGRFVQHVAQSDGSMREHEAGPAEYHVAHGHWHNAGSNVFTVYEHDLATQTRGEAKSEGRKTGMCFADVGVADPAWRGLQLPEHQGIQCFNPTVDQAWSMGLSPGWYDAYPWILGDQFVDVTGLDDGVYALCAVANAEGYLAESDATNNEGCTTFRLTADNVETLEPLPYHAEDPR